MDHLFLSYFLDSYGLWYIGPFGAVGSWSQHTDYFESIVFIFLFHIMLSVSLQTKPTSLAQCVQEYSLLEQEVQELSTKLKTVRERKAELQTKIIQTMKDANLENRTLKQGSHRFYIGTRKQYSALSFSYLETIFEKMIPDEANRTFLLEYLRENREVKTVDELKKY